MLDPATASGAAIWGGVFLLLAFALSWLIGRAVHGLGVGGADDHADRRARIRFVLQVVRLGVFLVAFVLWAHLVPSLRALGTALLASAGVVSVVLGIAAQNTIGNIIAGVSILIYEPFDIGDRLQVMAPTGLETGTVEIINLSHTVVTTFDNRRVTIPNGAIMSQTLVNLSSEDPKVMATVAVGVAYTADVAAARQVVHDLATAHPDVLGVVSIPVTALGASSVTLSARLWCADAATAKQVEYDMYESVLREFTARGIEIPYPWSNVIVHPAGGPGPAQPSAG